MCAASCSSSAAVFCFALLDTWRNLPPPRVPSLEVAWFRYAVNLIFAVVVLQPWRHLADYATERPWLQVWRAVFLLGSTVLQLLRRPLPAAGGDRLDPVRRAAARHRARRAGARRMAGPAPLGRRRRRLRRRAHRHPARASHPSIRPPCSRSPRRSATPAIRSPRACSRATDSPAGMLIYAALLATIVLTPALPPIARHAADLADRRGARRHRRRRRPRPLVPDRGPPRRPADGAGARSTTPSSSG